MAMPKDFSDEKKKMLLLSLDLKLAAVKRAQRAADPEFNEVYNQQVKKYSSLIQEVQSW